MGAVFEDGDLAGAGHSLRCFAKGTRLGEFRNSRPDHYNCTKEDFKGLEAISLSLRVTTWKREVPSSEQRRPGSRIEIDTVVDVN